MKQIVKRKRVGIKPIGNSLPEYTPKRNEKSKIRRPEFCHSCGKKKSCSFKLIGNGELLDCPDYEKVPKHR
jgi:hypothetical protein